MPKLSPEELAGAEVVGKLSPEDLANAEHVSKYPDPKSFSASDAELGIPATKTKVRIQDVGPARFAKEVLNPSELDETQANYLSKSPDPDLIANDPAAIQPGVNGVRAATTLAKAGASEAARLAGKTSLAERVADAMKKALGKTTEHSIFARGVEIALPGAVQAAEKATGAIAPAAKAAASAVAPAVAPAARAVSPLSNAVDRLRASAEISPSALDFTRRLDAAATPNGTVTQGTLGGTP